MRRLLIALLLLPSLAWGQEYARMNPYILGSGVSAASTTAFCTGAATCTATTPGACDMWCEDFEGSTDCDGAGDGTDENCRNAYTTNITSGDAIDFTSTASGTYPCTGTTNTNVVQISQADADQTDVRFDIGALKNTIVAQVYINVISETLPLNGTVMTLHADNASDYAMKAFNVEFVQDGTNTYHFALNYANDTPGTSTISCGNNTAFLNTWYRVTVYYSNRNAGDSVSLYVNGTQCGSTATDPYTRQARYFRFGDGVLGGYVAQWDNITIDDDTDANVGACP